MKNWGEKEFNMSNESDTIESELKQKAQAYIKNKYGKDLSLDKITIEKKIEGENEKMSENEDKTPTKEEFEKQANFEEHMRTFVKELRKAKEEDDLAQAEEKEMDVKFREGGKGNVGLRPEDLKREKGSSQEGYPSHEALIKDVCEKASESNEEMQEVKQKLWEKMVKGWKENPVQTMNQTTEFPNAVKDLLEKQNKQWRKSYGHKGDD